MSAKVASTSPVGGTGMYFRMACRPRCFSSTVTISDTVCGCVLPRLYTCRAHSTFGPHAGS
jgi:hypothetical protein